MGLADGVAWERDYGAPGRRTVAGQQSEADWIKDCTAKISGAIGGGSELFVKHGEGFRLDVDFVCKRIVEMRERHHEAKRSCVLTARQAEALQQEVDSLKQTRQHSREASAALHDAFMEERKRLEALQRENAELREAAGFVKPAMDSLKGYELDLGDSLLDEYELGRIEDSRHSPSFRIRVGHIRRLARALIGGENAGN